MTASDGDSGRVDGQQKNDCESTTKPPPPAASTAATTPATISHHISALQRLDKEYGHLRSTEENIETCLHQLQQEEASLRLALEQSSTSLKEQREKERNREDKEAVARLEEALMKDSDSDDSSCWV
ncbi:hypothetical protein ACHAXR_012086 [Thalassiosira sp. AJA248-18]